MNCCKCKKFIDVTKSIVPPEWYGSYRFDKLLKIICADCIKIYKDWYKNENNN